MAGDRDESADERHDRNWSDILQELRVTLTGTQLISGFLLAVAFQSRFDELHDWQLWLYLALVALAAVATLTGLAPVIVHRALAGRHVKEVTVRLGDALLVVTMAIVTVLVIGVATLIFAFVAGSTAGLVAGIVAVVLAIGVWAVGASARRHPMARSREQAP